VGFLVCIVELSKFLNLDPMLTFVIAKEIFEGFMVPDYVQNYNKMVRRGNQRKMNPMKTEKKTPDGRLSKVQYRPREKLKI